MKIGETINAKTRFEMMEDKYLEFGAVITENIESIEPLDSTITLK